MHYHYVLGKFTTWKPTVDRVYKMKQHVKPANYWVRSHMENFSNKEVMVVFGSKANKNFSVLYVGTIESIAIQLQFHQYGKVSFAQIDREIISGMKFYAMLRKNNIDYKRNNDINFHNRYTYSRIGNELMHV